MNGLKETVFSLRQKKKKKNFSLENSSDQENEKQAIDPQKVKYCLIHRL